MGGLPPVVSFASRYCAGDPLNGKTVVLWRHGQTDWNARRRFQGQSDVPLDEVGERQAELAAAVLAQLDPDAIVSSDLQRARQTADALAQEVSLPVALDSRLRETGAGNWEGLDREVLEQRYGPELSAWAAGSDLAPGGGEPRSVVAARMLAAIEEHSASIAAGGTIVVVTHGGSARAAIGSMLGLPVAYWGMLGVLSNARWCVLTETRGLPLPGGRSVDELRQQFPDVPEQPEWRLVEYNARSLVEEAIGDDR